MKIVIVGEGVMGKPIKHFFSRLGHEVRGVDGYEETMAQMPELAKWADVIFFAVPINQTGKMINKFVGRMNQGSCVISLASVAEPIRCEPVNLELMATAGNSYLHCHIMLKPTPDPYLESQIEGKNVLVSTLLQSPPPPGCIKWQNWLLKSFEPFNPNIFVLESGVHHDRICAFCQVLHMTNSFVMAELIMHDGGIAMMGIKLGAPAFQLFASSMLRAFEQMDVTAQILVYNPFATDTIQASIQFQQQLIKLIAEGRPGPIAKRLNQARLALFSRSNSEYRKFDANTQRLIDAQAEQSSEEGKND